MKIQNINISANGSTEAATKAQEGKKNQSVDKKAIFAGGMNLQQGQTDALQQRKEEAQKKAMKIVSDVFSADTKVDDAIQGHRDNQETLSTENVNLIEQKTKLERQLGGEDGSGNEELDDQARAELQASIDVLDAKIDTNKATMVGDSKAISGIKLAQVKSHPMIDAEKTADKMMQAASDALVGGVLKEAVEHVDETMEENKKDGEKLNEEIDKKQEMAESDEKKASDANSADTEQQSNVASTQKDVNRELKKVRDEMDVLEEDLKGAVVDEGL